MTTAMTTATMLTTALTTAGVAAHATATKVNRQQQHYTAKDLPTEASTHKAKIAPADNKITARVAKASTAITTKIAPADNKITARVARQAQQQQQDNTSAAFCARALTRSDF